jgi:hypothetical protein
VTPNFRSCETDFYSSLSTNTAIMIYFPQLFNSTRSCEDVIFGLYLHYIVYAFSHLSP